jgi:hypothetical protein
MKWLHAILSKLDERRSRATGEPVDVVDMVGYSKNEGMPIRLEWVEAGVVTIEYCPYCAGHEDEWRAMSKAKRKGTK